MHGRIEAGQGRGDAGVALKVQEMASAWRAGSMV